MDPEHDSARLPSIARMDDTLALLETGFVSPGASGDALAAGRRAAAVAARSGAPSGRGRSGLLTGLLVCLQCCPPCRRSTDEGVAFSRSASATYRPEAACGGKAPDSFDPPRPPSCTAALSGEGAVRRRAGGLCEDGCARREIDCPHSKFEFAHSKSSSGAFVFFLVLFYTCFEPSRSSLGRLYRHAGRSTYSSPHSHSPGAARDALAAD